jgi:hypothetical protein
MSIASAIYMDQPDPSRLVDLPKALALLERADALDPSVEDAGPARVLGLVWGRSPAAGGDPPRSRRWFDKAIARTDGHYLMTRVMFARSYAVAVRDRELFERTLHDVLAEPPERAPEYRLPNALAKRRAALFLAREDRLLPK